MPDRVWAFLAVSSSPQELSLDAQEAWAHEAAAANGWSIARTWKGVSSGREGARQLFEDMLAELRSTLKAERPKYVLMVRLDRMGRGTGIEGIAALAEIRKLGTQLYTREDGIVRIERASDAILPTIRSIVAALENETRADRVRAGKSRRRAAGLHNGNPPYGCTLLDGRAVAYEPEAVLTRGIFERRAAGWGYDRLAKYASERAIPKLLRNGATRELRWGRSTIQRLIWCRTLRGTAVPDALWDEANAIANPDFKARKLMSWPFPLAGALRCTCGSTLSGQSSGRRNSRERYYVCRRIATHGYYPYWRASLTETAFQSFLQRLIASPELLDPSARREDLAALRVKERQIKGELDAIEDRRRQIWEVASALTGEQLRERLDEIDAARARQREIYENVRAEFAAASSVSDSTTTLAEALTRLALDWPDAPLALQQETARAIAQIATGLFVEPSPKIPAKELRQGRLMPIEIFTGYEITVASEQHMSENMREVDTLRNVDMAQRKMDALRTIATRRTLLSVARRARSDIR